jgi:glycosyltransferase involved in cell wall biosynthesis
MISVLILTLNEKLNLPVCLESVSWSDDVVVFDSYSVDDTVDIGRAFGARVFQREFDNYAAQRNAGLHEVEYRNPWVLMVDADERWDAKLANEMYAAINDPARKNVTLYHFRRKDMFMGRWLKRSTGYPTWAGRLVRPDKVWVERDINEEYHTDGEVGYLNGHFIHHPFNKGIDSWFERHNRYSSMEAETIVRDRLIKMSWSNLISSIPMNRRKALKQLAYRLPFRPQLVFVYLIVIRFGFMDGMPGMTYARMRAMYERLINLKVMELDRRTANNPL